MPALQRPEQGLQQPSNTDFFTEAGRSLIRGRMRYRTVRTGAVIFREGETADKLYWITKGRVKLTNASRDGKQITISLYGDGDMFGQWVPYTDSRHTFNAEAAEDTEFGVMERKEIEGILAVHPELSVMMMKWLGLNQSRLESMFRDLFLFGKMGALCSVLIRLSNTYGIHYGSDICISLKLTHSELAEMIGSTREGVNRMLADMRQEGRIAHLNGHLVLKDMGYLRRMCQCELCPAGVCRM